VFAGVGTAENKKAAGGDLRLGLFRFQTQYSRKRRSIGQK
jgi:hypothetical protein